MMMVSEYGIFCIVYYFLNLTAITVGFDNATYTVVEDTGIVQPALILSNPSSFVETVQVISTDITADGMYNHTIIIL